MRIINIFVCLLIDGGILIRYKLALVINKRARLTRWYEGLCSNTRNTYLLLIELFVCSIVMPPGFEIIFKGYMFTGEYIYSMDGLILILTMVKSYHIIRVYSHFSKFNNSKSAKLFFQKFRMKQSHTFFVKGDLRNRSIKIAATCLLIIVMYLGIILFYVERSFIPLINGGKIYMKHYLIS